MIVFRKRFVNKLQNLEQYLLSEFGPVVTKKFIDRMGNAIQRAALLPNPGRSTAIPGIRSIFIPPYIRVYFTKRAEKTIVLNMYDMRQDPKKNMYETK